MLSFSRIGPGSIYYGTCLSAARAALNMMPGQSALIYDLDVASNGMAVTPAVPVDVELTVENGGRAAHVIRVSDGAELEAVTSRKGKKAIVRFSTDTFGEFCLVFDN